MRRNRLSTRRDFLQQGLRLVGAGVSVPLWLGTTAHALEDPRKARNPAPRGVEHPILVVLELSGGNDVLSTVVPYTDPTYYNVRRHTAIKASACLVLDDRVGLNPQLKGLHELYQQGDLTIVQAVGYPNHSRSHFHSMDIYHTCDHARPQGVDGWLARYVESRKIPDANFAISLGGQTPRALIGRKYRSLNLAAELENFQWRAGQDEAGLNKTYRRLNRPQASDNKTLEFLTRMAMKTNASTDAVRRAVSRFRPSEGYDGELGESLARVAALIAGGMKTQLYYVRQGGYDTHAGQRERHDGLMLNLSRNVRTFLKDLKRIKQDRRVVMVAFSEFGRRVAENAAAGTDHGAGGAMFLFGAPVKGGMVGRHPSLTDLDNGDLKWRTDFRSVYATLIEDWLGGTARTVLGKSYPKLKLL